MKIFTLINKIMSGFKYRIIYFRSGRQFKSYHMFCDIIKPVRIDGSKYIEIREGVIIQKNSWLLAMKVGEKEPLLSINSGCHLGYRNHITAIEKVILGKNVLTACNVYISDNYHCFSNIDIPIMDQPVLFKGSVVIGDGSWLGENVCVIGANVGRNCVIGANAVVTNDIPDYSVAVGAPARVIKKYNCDLKVWQRIDR